MAQKVCAFCGFHLCLNHHVLFVNTSCEARHFGYLKTYYSHEWWDTSAYYDPRNPAGPLTEQPIEFLGFQDDKFVVMTAGHKRPPGKFARGVSFKPRPDAFLKIDGIPGESTDDRYTGWIEVVAYSHELEQEVGGPASTSGGASAGRCDHGPFVVTKLLDKASPKIAEACCKGAHIKLVELSLNRAGGDKLEYMNYKLHSAMVTSVRSRGDTGGKDTMPAEEIQFTYAGIEWTYTQQKRTDGTGGGKVAAGWDLVKNIAV